MKRFSQTIKVAMALFVAVFSNSLLPTTAAYAAEQDASQRPGTYQPVWCKLTGNQWKAQLSANGQGKDGPLTIPVDGYTIVDGQIVAHDHNDKLDSACEKQYGTVRVTAVNGTFTDTCGASFNLVFTPAQTTGVTYVQTRTFNKITVTAVAQPGYTLTNPSWSQSVTDTLQACPPVVIQLPSAPAPNDLCGLHNAEWVLPGNTAAYTWSLVNGHLIVTAAQGYVFSGNKTSFDYGVAPDSNKLCVVDTPQKPQQEDPCGTHNAHWILPSDTDQIDWSLNQYGELTATAKPDYVFSNGKTFINFGKAIDSNTPCVIAIPETPKTHDPCGLHNAGWIIPHDTNEIDWSLNYKGELLASAKSGFVFSDGKTVRNYGQAPDSGELCRAEPQAPTFIDYCGTQTDYVVIPSVKGVTYKINGKPVHAGYQAVHGTVLVTVVADKDYVLVGEERGPWTFTSLSSECITITKKSKPVTDTNNNGTIGVGDTVTWVITVTNNSDNDYDNFRVELDDASATLVDNDAVVGGVIKYLKHGTSVTVEATSVLTVSDVQACKASNTVTFMAWFNRKHHNLDNYGHDSQAFSLRHDNDDETEYDITGSADAEATFTCPTPGSGSGGGTTTTSTTSETPSVLPSTGPSDSNPMLIFAGSAIAYIATYLIQRRRELMSN